MSRAAVPSFAQHVAPVGLSGSHGSLRSPSPETLTRRRAYSLQGERAALLQRLCTWLKGQRESGRSLRAASRAAAKRWRGKRPFKSDPASVWTMSAKSLARNFCRWERAGQIADCFLRKPTIIRQVRREQALAFVRALARPECESALGAYRVVAARAALRGKTIPSYSAFARLLPSARGLRRLNLAIKVATRRRAQLFLGLEVEVSAKFAKGGKPLNFDI